MHAPIALQTKLAARRLRIICAVNIIEAKRWAATRASLYLLFFYCGFAGIQTVHAFNGDMCLAVVSNTPDGFLNLREEPNANSKIIARLAPGDRVFIYTGICADLADDPRSCIKDETWVRVVGLWDNTASIEELKMMLRDYRKGRNANYAKKISDLNQKMAKSRSPGWIRSKFVRGAACY